MKNWSNFTAEEKALNLRQIMETYDTDGYNPEGMAYNIRYGYENDPDWFDFKVDDLDEFESDLSDMINTVLSARIKNIVSKYTPYQDGDPRSHDFAKWAEDGEYNSCFVDEDGTTYYKIKKDDDEWAIVSFDEYGNIVAHF